MPIHQESLLNLFSSAKRDSRVGVLFLSDGVAVAQVKTGKKQTGLLMRSEFIPADNRQAQVQALANWVRDNNLQKTPCICVANPADYDVYQVEKPEVPDEELVPAVTWKIKDLLSYDVTQAVVDCYPMPASSKNSKSQVSVVSAAESSIGAYVTDIKTTGLNLQAIDIPELVLSNLQLVQDTDGLMMAVLLLGNDRGMLNIYRDGDLYVSRELKIGTNQLQQITSEDQSVFDSLMLEIQRSTDYFEGFYGLGAVNHLRVFPRLPITEKMAMYLQNLTNFDIDFIEPEGAGQGFEENCFLSYCAAMKEAAE